MENALFLILEYFKTIITKISKQCIIFVIIIFKNQIIRKDWSSFCRSFLFNIIKIFIFYFNLLWCFRVLRKIDKDQMKRWCWAHISKERSQTWKIPITETDVKWYFWVDEAKIYLWWREGGGGFARPVIYVIPCFLLATNWTFSKIPNSCVTISHTYHKSSYVWPLLLLIQLDTRFIGGGRWSLDYTTLFCCNLYYYDPIFGCLYIIEIHKKCTLSGDFCWHNGV